MGSNLLDMYRSRVDETKQMLDDSRTMQTLSDAADRGVNIEVIVHANDSKTLRELVKEGKVTAYYSPEPTVFDKDTAGFAVFDKDGFMQTFLNGISRFMKHSQVMGQLLSYDLMSRKEDTYIIPPEKADTVFDMIGQHQAPKNIVGYLTR